MHLQHVLTDYRTRPDTIHQVILGDQLTRGLDQDNDDLESPPSQRNAAPRTRSSCRARSASQSPQT